MGFKKGQIFEGKYPPEAAAWCNESGKYHIEEMEPLGTETDELTGKELPVRRFRIVENAPVTETEEEQAAREERAKQLAFLATGGERLDAVETVQEDMVLLLADMVGGEG
jgi:hypothetical protein